MAALIHERVGIRDTSRCVSVPASPTAKLMYYLNCVASVIQLDKPWNLHKLRNHEIHYSLNETEVDSLLTLVQRFSPDELIGKVFFHSEDCRGANQFIELSSVTHMIAVSDNVLIGGEMKKVAKIMFFKRSWLEDNYISSLMSFGIDPLMAPNEPHSPSFSCECTNCACNIL